jgi:hypothetical protein
MDSGKPEMTTGGAGDTNLQAFELQTSSDLEQANKPGTPPATSGGNKGTQEPVNKRPRRALDGERNRGLRRSREEEKEGGRKVK